MGISAYQGRNPASAVLFTNPLLHSHGQSDYRSHAHRMMTTDAPWNVTQWVDPFDPHPKVATMPVILVVRKRAN